jgi:hypothetical protein
MSKADMDRKLSLDDDELSDLDDDVIENDNTVDWFEEEDELPDEVVEVAPKEVKAKITDPFLLANIDLYHALCEMEDVNFVSLEYSKQVELMNSLKIRHYKPGEVIFEEDDPISTALYIVVASDRTAKVAEVEIMRNSEDKLTKVLSRMRRGHFFGQKYFLTKQQVRKSSNYCIFISTRLRKFRLFHYSIFIRFLFLFFTCCRLLETAQFVFPLIPLVMCAWHAWKKSILKNGITSELCC